MNPLGPPDTHHLLAAAGWLDLGNPREALLDLNRVAAENREHLDVLDLEWAIHAAGQNWTEALRTAENLVRLRPDQASGWLHQAYALRRVAGGGLERAWAALRPVWDRFPRETLVSYNLACYACQLQLLDEARTWLRRAAAVAGSDVIKSMAQADDDLQPLWAEIQDW